MKNNKLKKLGPVIIIVVILSISLGVISSSNRKEKINKGGEYINSSVETVRISLDEFIGWKSLIYANGGLITTTNSINARNGIKIQYVIENDATVSSDSLISGDLQGAGYTINRLSFLQSKFNETGMNVVMPYITNYSNGGDGIIAKSSITSVNDLVGAKIGVPEFSEAQTLVIWFVNNSNLSDDQKSEIIDNLVLFATADDTAKAFFAGQVDVAATWEPYLTQAQNMSDAHVRLQIFLRPLRSLQAALPSDYRRPPEAGAKNDFSASAA